MGGKSKGAPPPPAPLPPAATPIDPMSFMGPIMGMMNQVMQQMAQSQMQMFQILQTTSAPPALENNRPTIDWDAKRQELKEKLEANPGEDRTLQGRSSTVLTSVLDDDDSSILSVRPGGTS